MKNILVKTYDLGDIRANTFRRVIRDVPLRPQKEGRSVNLRPFTVRKEFFQALYRFDSYYLSTEESQAVRLMYGDIETIIIKPFVYVFGTNKTL